MSCHVANEESSHEHGVSFVHPNSQECSTQLCAETCCGEKCLASWKNQACFCFGFLQNVNMMRLVMNSDNVFVRAGLFDETNPFFVSALTAANSIPSTLQASLRCFVDPSFTFENDDDPDNWSTDAKLKLKLVCLRRWNSRCCVCDGGTAYGGSVARQSIDVGP